MVILLVHLLLLLPSFLCGKEFTASVRELEVSINEVIHLELTLKDATPKSAPSLESLNQAFHIHSQRQSFSTSIINGKVNSSTTWTLILIPNKLGKLVIPSICVETSEGPLFTSPICLAVVDEKQNLQGKKDADIRLETDVSSFNPYKNEPFFLIIRLISQKPLTNIRVDKFNIEEAILESVGTPIVYEKIENGIKFGVVEFKYMITPLQSGLMKISPIKVLGDISLRKNVPSLFDDMLGDFSMMPGLVSLQPFCAVTKEIEIKIRKAIEGQLPWLPACSLEIKESFDHSQTIQEGEVFTRSFVITAEGIHSSQLPSLEEKQVAGQFKVYPDKPQFKDEIVNGKLISTRIEQYTLIPEKSGDLTLPNILVNWWDTAHEKRSETHVKERKLQVLPALKIKSDREVALNENLKLTNEKEESTLQTEQTNYLYIFIGGLILLIIVLFVMLFLLRRKMSRMVNSPVEKKPIIHPEKKQKTIPPINPSFSRSKTEKLKDLNPT